MPAGEPLALPGLEPEEVVVVLDGETYRVPARPAVDWVRVVVSNDPLGIFPGMLADEDDWDWVIERLCREEEFYERAMEVSRKVLTAVAGRPWWQTDKLIQLAGVQWQRILGAMTLRGARPDRMSLPAFLSAVYGWYCENLETEDRQKLDDELATPPRGLEDETVPTGEEAMDDMLADLGSMGMHTGA
jgi:hypothetical protein